MPFKQTVQVLVEILYDRLAPVVRDSLLPDMTREKVGMENSGASIAALSTSAAVVPVTSLSITTNERNSLESLILRLEESVRSLEQASTKKKEVEKQLRDKTEEHQELTDQVTSMTKKKVAAQKDRIIACEKEITELKRELNGACRGRTAYYALEKK